MVRFNIPQLNTNKQLYEKFIITASIHLVYNTEHHHFSMTASNANIVINVIMNISKKSALRIAATCLLRKRAIGYASLLGDTVTECRLADRKVVYEDDY